MASGRSPAILPITYAMHQGLVYFRTLPDGLLAELAQPTSVALEVDELDAANPERLEHSPARTHQRRTRTRRAGRSVGFGFPGAMGIRNANTVHPHPARHGCWPDRATSNLNSRERHNGDQARPTLVQCRVDADDLPHWPFARLSVVAASYHNDSPKKGRAALWPSHSQQDGEQASDVWSRNSFMKFGRKHDVGVARDFAVGQKSGKRSLAY